MADERAAGIYTMRARRVDCYVGICPHCGAALLVENRETKVPKKAKVKAKPEPKKPEPKKAKKAKAEEGKPE